MEDLPSKTSAFDSLSAAGHAWKAKQLCRAEESTNFPLSAGTRLNNLVVIQPEQHLGRLKDQWPAHWASQGISRHSQHDQDMF